MEIEIRRANINDIDDIVELRKDLFISMGSDKSKVNTMTPTFRKYFLETIPSEEYYGWVVEKGGNIISTGGLVVDRHPPSLNNEDGRFAYIMNMSTTKKYRHQGIGKKVLDTMVEFADDLGISFITLHYSEFAKKWYDKLGFKETNEMKISVQDYVDNTT